MARRERHPRRPRRPLAYAAVVAAAAAITAASLTFLLTVQTSGVPSKSPSSSGAAERSAAETRG